MIVHGLSHGLAAVMCSLGVELVQQFLLDRWPGFYSALHEQLMHALMVLPWTMNQSRFADGVLIVLLGFVWGAAFKWLND